MIRFEPINQSAHSGWAAAAVFAVAAIHPSLVLLTIGSVMAVALFLEVLDHFVKKVQTLLESAIDVAFYALGSGGAYLVLILAHRT